MTTSIIITQAESVARRPSKARSLLGFLWVIRIIPSCVAVAAAYAGFTIASDQLVWPKYSSHLIVVFFLTSAGFALNDYLDRHVDAINLSYRPLPSGMVSPTIAKWYAVIGFVGANLVGWALSIESGIYCLFATGTFVVYTPAIKPVLLLKNVYIALYYGSLLLYAGMIAGNVGVVLSSFFASLPLLFAREVLMDIRDKEGDAIAGYVTLPIRFGQRIARAAVFVFLAFGALLLWTVLPAGSVGRIVSIVGVALVVLSAVIAAALRTPSRMTLTVMIQLILFALTLEIVGAAVGG